MHSRKLKKYNNLYYLQVIKPLHSKHRQFISLICMEFNGERRKIMYPFTFCSVSSSYPCKPMWPRRLWNDVHSEVHWIDSELDYRDVSLFQYGDAKWPSDVWQVSCASQTNFRTPLQWMTFLNSVMTSLRVVPLILPLKDIPPIDCDNTFDRYLRDNKFMTRRFVRMFLWDDKDTFICFSACVFQWRQV